MTQVQLTEPSRAPAEPPRRLRMPRGAGWRTALREFLVIVAGVLAALGAQAWWEGRQEREREQEYLHQLLADVRENEHRLNDAIREDSAGAHALSRVMRAMQAPEPLPAADSLLAWILRAGAASDFQPLTGTSGALLMTGDLRLVRNDTLRARLVAYSATLESEHARQQQLREATLALIGPLARALPFLQGVFLNEVHAGDADFQRMRSDPEAAVLFFSLQANTMNRLSGLRRARDEARRMRRALEAEPALRPSR
jgi:hypothetical protein